MKTLKSLLVVLISLSLVHSSSAFANNLSVKSERRDVDTLLEEAEEEFQSIMSHPVFREYHLVDSENNLSATLQGMLQGRREIKFTSPAINDEGLKLGVVLKIDDPSQSLPAGIVSLGIKLTDDSFSKTFERRALVLDLNQPEDFQLQIESQIDQMMRSQSGSIEFTQIDKAIFGYFFILLKATIVLGVVAGVLHYFLDDVGVKALKNPAAVIGALAGTAAGFGLIAFVSYLIARIPMAGYYVSKGD